MQQKEFCKVATKFIKKHWKVLQQQRKLEIDCGDPTIAKFKSTTMPTTAEKKKILLQTSKVWVDPLSMDDGEIYKSWWDWLWSNPATWRSIFGLTCTKLEKYGRPTAFLQKDDWSYLSYVILLQSVSRHFKWGHAADEKCGTG